MSQVFVFEEGDILSEEWETLGVFGSLPRVFAIFWHSVEKKILCQFQGGELDGRILKPVISKTPKGRLEAIGLTLLYMSSARPFLMI